MSLLRPLSGLFAAGVAVRNSLYDSGALKQERLSWPVISVGNLRVGGTGKTPFVIFLGEQLQRLQYPFTVLSRGYGRKSTRTAMVDENGSVNDFGDEPLLISRKLHVPVIAGADRFASGRWAESRFADLQAAHGKRWLHILDDGFQHRRLARDVDVVLVSPTDAADSLLPAGRLREPLSSLKRADIIVLMDGAEIPSQGAQGKGLFRARRTIELPPGIPQRVLAFAGIARTQSFFQALEESGLRLADVRKFRDHHGYSRADIDSLRRMRKLTDTTVFVTTEKDEINLRSAGLWDELQPIYCIPMRLEMAEADTFMSAVLAKLSSATS